MNQAYVLFLAVLLTYQFIFIPVYGDTEIRAGNCILATPVDLVKTEHIQKMKIPFFTRSSKFEWFGNTKIYCLQVLNHKTDSKASASIVGGGVGENFVKIALKSGKGKGLDYLINIYAKYY